ncbi:hypothetical protein H9P43_000513 [Blastocladiella emersonii ATCC 22665]|nr:hypothetical protein H9P43_000513 [Blastocladiella emersonii ATCC 22665]
MSATTPANPAAGATPGGIPSPATVLVTGATGTTGFEVLKVLTSRDYHPRFNVVAGVHNEHSLAILDDVDVVRHIDADNLGELNFAGVDILFIIPSNAENRVEQVRNYVRAATRDRVKFILLLSVVRSEARDSLFARQFHDMEQIVSESGIPCAFLRCTFFQQNFYTHARELVRNGQLSLPIRRGKCAPVNVRDVARASCAILRDTAIHAFKAYDLVGPELMDGPDLAAAASRGLGRPVTFRDCSPAEFIDMYVAQGVPAWLARGFAELLELVATGALGALETKAFYSDLTGYDGTTVEQFFVENGDRLGDVATRGEGAAPVPTAVARGGGGGGPGSGMVAATSAYSGGGGGAEPGLAQGQELYLLLRELVADKHRTVQSKKEWLRSEERRLDQLLDIYERFESSMSLGGGRGGDRGGYGGPGGYGQGYGGGRGGGDEYYARAPPLPPRGGERMPAGYDERQYRDPAAYRPGSAGAYPGGGGGPEYGYERGYGPRGGPAEYRDPRARY